MDPLSTLRIGAALALIGALWTVTPVLAKGSLNQHTQCSDHADSVLCAPTYVPPPERPWKKLHGADDPE